MLMGNLISDYVPPDGLTQISFVERSWSADFGRCTFRRFRKSIALLNMRNGLRRPEKKKCKIQPLFLSAKEVNPSLSNFVQ